LYIINATLGEYMSMLIVVSWLLDGSCRWRYKTSMFRMVDTTTVLFYLSPT